MEFLKELTLYWSIESRKRNSEVPIRFINNKGSFWAGYKCALDAIKRLNNKEYDYFYLIAEEQLKREIKNCVRCEKGHCRKHNEKALKMRAKEIQELSNS